MFLTLICVYILYYFFFLCSIQIHGNTIPTHFNEPTISIEIFYFNHTKLGVNQCIIMNKQSTNHHCNYKDNKSLLAFQTSITNPHPQKNKTHKFHNNFLDLFNQNQHETDTTSEVRIKFLKSTFAHNQNKSLCTDLEKKQKYDNCTYIINKGITKQQFNISSLSITFSITIH